MCCANLGHVTFVCMTFVTGGKAAGSVTENLGPRTADTKAFVLCRFRCDPECPDPEHELSCRIS